MKIRFKNGSRVIFSPLAFSPVGVLKILWTGRKLDRKYGPKVAYQAAMKDGQK